MRGLSLAGIVVLASTVATPAEPGRPRARDLGIAPGVFAPGPLNAITDVPGVRVGHFTLVRGDNVRTGATAILPHPGNIFQEKVPAAIVVGNGFGKLVGVSQVQELGLLETPILLTNTLNVWEAAATLVDYTLKQSGNESVRSVNPVVGETNDGYLNDIRGRHLRVEHFLEALARAHTGPVEEGAVGAGTGTVAFGFKGGIGTASRRLPDRLGGYTVGVLVQTNYGGVLTIDGVPVGKEMGQHAFHEPVQPGDGSCMIVVATDAPLAVHGLQRLARRALTGMARTGASFSHGSGDYVIAFSTALALRTPHQAGPHPEKTETLRGDDLSPLFQAVAEATEEAIYNSLLRATSMHSREGHEVPALPIDALVSLLKKYGRGR